jgi:hypothetical protein
MTEKVMTWKEEDGGEILKNWLNKVMNPDFEIPVIQFDPSV